jgi:3'-phosphoadenosine 5'-phosphosulfate sulfotransferase (PAPS reductase)/FAD synthetase
MPPLFLPDSVLLMLQAGMDCAVSISGGKDSQALLMSFVLWFRAQGFSGKLFALHVDLGRAERTETPGFIASLCAQLAIPLHIVRPVVGGQIGDLQDVLQRRMQTLAGTGTPFWPTKSRRYCTSKKRDACDKELRGSPLILSLEGIRASESVIWRIICQEQEMGVSVAVKLGGFGETECCSDVAS